jgi:uncharacterized membrane-anchored protein
VTCRFGVKSASAAWRALLSRSLLLFWCCGTALGDWMADDTGLGYRGSALLIGVVLAVLATLYFFTTVSRPLLFWAAFILTRPLGATIANSLDKPVAAGGLAVGDFTASAALAVVMLACILVLPQKPGRLSVK